MIGGLSRTSAVGDIVAAVLGLVAGASVFVFGVERSKGLIASVGMLAFAVSVFVGYVAAATARVEDDMAQASLEACHKGFTDPNILGDDVAMCRFLRLYTDDCLRVFTEGRVLTDLERGLIDFTEQQFSLRHFGVMATNIQEMLDDMEPSCEVVLPYPYTGRTPAGTLDPSRTLHLPGG